jgi:hypothetical protein
LNHNVLVTQTSFLPMIFITVILQVFWQKLGSVG